MSTAHADAQPNRREAPSAGILDQVIAATPQESPELAAMRMENEVMLSECRMRPRNMTAIKEELSQLLSAFPALAEDSIYSKPVGKDEKGKQRYADGLSIRAAETLREVYGYNRVRADCTPLDKDVSRMKIDASFTDFQRCQVWQDGGIVSAHYKSSKGGMARYSEDRFLNVVVKAEVSRRLREVILRSINPALKAWFEAECRKVLEQTLTPEKVGRIIQRAAGYGVKQEQLEALFGKPASMGWTNNDFQRLVGIFNAIKEGETTVEEAFSVQKTRPEGALTQVLDGLGEGEQGKPQEAPRDQPPTADAEAATPAPPAQETSLPDTEEGWKAYFLAADSHRELSRRLDELNTGSDLPVEVRDRLSDFAADCQKRLSQHVGAASPPVEAAEPPKPGPGRSRKGQQAPLLS